MKLTFLALSVIIFSFQAIAQSPSMSEQRFCADRLDKNFVKKLAMDSDNLMPFTSKGGFGNQGVCWWHARFVRNALYLTIFKPRLPRPTEEEAVQLVKKIRAATEVVVIPGYRNFSDFSSDNEEIIQKELNKWQRGDSFLRFAWIDGLSGSSSVTPLKMKELMDQIYQEVEVNKNIGFNKLQIKGIAAHSWLVVNMKKVPGGYELGVVDSYISGEYETYYYREGETEISHKHGSFSFTPYLERSDELLNIYNTISDKCIEK